MARSKETKIELTAYDDLFETDQSREEAKLSKIRDIPISEIDEFPDHPFKVFIDEDMEQLVDSIKRNGVMTPATVTEMSRRTAPLVQRGLPPIVLLRTRSICVMCVSLTMCMTNTATKRQYVQKFLLELGRGFSFVARQERITFDGRHFRIDLVFYNYILKCFVLIDLKVGDLTHQDLGQMQMYVHYYERELMNEGDNPPIGIVLCADKSESVVKYMLPENEI